MSQGIDGFSDVLTVTTAGVARQGGGFYSFEGERISEERGKNATKRAMNSQPELVARIRDAVLNPVEENDETGE